MEKNKYTIGLLVDYLVSEYTDGLYDGMAECCRDMDMNMMLFPMSQLGCMSMGFDYQYAAVTALATEKNIDGVVMTSGTQIHSVTLDTLSSYIRSFRPLPVVNISIPVPGIPSIVVDCRKACSDLVDYLVDICGCGRFGIMGVDSASSEVHERMDVFMSSLASHGITADSIVVWNAKFTADSAAAELDRYVSGGGKLDFDAIIALNDDMAFGVMDFCRGAGLEIPEDILVTGFDDIQRASFSSPSLTTVNQQLFRQGYAAAAALRSLIEGKSVPPVQVIHAKAVLRESTGKIPPSFFSTDIIERDDTSKFSCNTKFTVLEWFNRKNQLYRAARYYTDCQYITTMWDLKGRINYDLKAFGISSGAIVLYESPVEMKTGFEYFNLPHRAYLMSAFDKDSGFYFLSPESPEFFNPNDGMLPPGIRKFFTGETIAMPLFYQAFQYGYMIINRGSYDMACYDIFGKTVSYLLATVKSYSEIEREKSHIIAENEKLNRVAHTDELTGIRNRRGFMDDGNEMMRYSERMGLSGFVIYCDMDGLKKINDTYGHDAGDRAITAEAKILEASFRKNDIVARIAGDEFAVIGQGLTEAVFERIRRVIDTECRRWTEKNGAPFRLSISMGYVKFPDEKLGYKLSNLMAEADSSLYMDKRKHHAEARAAGEKAASGR